MTSRSTRFALTGLLATGCLGLVAACGKDSGSDKLTASCKADAGVNDGFNQLFTQTPALQSDKPPSKSAVPQIRSNYDKFVAGPLAQIQKDPPKEIAGDIKTAVAASEKIPNGDLSAVMSPSVDQATTRIDAYYFDNCKDQKIDVKGLDYAFGGLKPTYSPGVTRFKLDNTGKEVHEMNILRRKPGVTESFDQILKLPQDKAMSKVDFVTSADGVDPRKASYGSANLTPGQYIAVCFIPKGTTSLKTEGKGPPHFVLGMKMEFKVE